ncbi:secreted RxLR effector protein 161-like [Impatiens glandulifera]|uniref:secreted RxLR effector protein 161-like n=1 Tax=Impatiens glandulifera TaxID=253017 RepID=UPI001FB11562|nr:secreted RxLR effector protein 161-like [Impatiens glandulifera]
MEDWQVPLPRLIDEGRYNLCLTGCKPVDIPIKKGIKLNELNSPELAEPEMFRRLVGRLIYLSFTRPDIGFSVQQLSQYMQKLLEVHWEVALQVVKYLKGTPSLGLFYSCNTNSVLEAFSDADWATCTDSRRSLTGYCVKLGGAMVSWKTKTKHSLMIHCRSGIPKHGHHCM